MQVDGRSPSYMESGQKLMESLPAALKVDKSGQKVSLPHGNLMEVNGWSSGSTHGNRRKV